MLTANLPLATSHLSLPRHVAIIMDGNGRWARAQGLSRTTGHKRGAETLKTVMSACREHGVEYLTIYAFSAENWKRPASEILDLMQLLKLYLSRELKDLHKNGIRLRFIGDLALLDADIRAMLEDAQTLTQNNRAFVLTVALSYGARQELVRAMRELATQVAADTLAPEDITEQTLSQALDTHELPDPDLLIRTGGEQRLSNFLLWQSAYTELYFTPVLWPDFSAADFEEALQAYARRERRYGNAV